MPFSLIPYFLLPPSLSISLPFLFPFDCSCLCDAGRDAGSTRRAAAQVLEMQLNGTVPGAATYGGTAFSSMGAACRARDFELGLRVFNAMIAIERTLSSSLHLQTPGGKARRGQEGGGGVLRPAVDGEE